MNTIFNSLSTENKKQLLQFKYDYFFHYLLMNSDDIRLTLCRYISGEDGHTAAKETRGGQRYGNNIKTNRSAGISVST